MVKEVSININWDRLVDACLLANGALLNRIGVARKGIKQFLPEFNLPPELEYSPQKIETIDPLRAAQYLFVLVSMERKSRSSENILNGLATWENQDIRWIFDPYSVSQKSLLDVTKVCKGSLHYTLSGFAGNYYENAIRIVREYSGDPRKLVQGKTVEQAKLELESFKGIGTGIANLFIHYCLDRKLASPTDPRNALLKVDIHKSRIPLNLDCINIEGDTVRRDSLVEGLEQAYWKICLEHNLDPSLLDSILWVIGSEICVKQDLRYCRANCPLEKLCVSLVPEDANKGEFIVYNTDRCGQRKRVEKRRHAKQIPLF